MQIDYVDAESLEGNDISVLNAADAILVPGGFGERGTEGKMRAIQYARENKLPFFGICLGMQLAVIEFARHVAGLPEATSTEFNRSTKYPLIGLITGSVTLTGGHGTAGAWGTVFEQDHAIKGAIVLGMASATFGLVIGGMMGGGCCKISHSSF